MINQFMCAVNGDLSFNCPDFGDRCVVDSHNLVEDNHHGTLFVIDAYQLDATFDQMYWSHSLQGGAFFGGIEGPLFLGHFEEGSKIF